jgi:hypothetical protein
MNEAGNEGGSVTVGLPYTKAELRKFDRLTDQASSQNQMARISARLALNAFIKEHGREKCDAMWNEIMVREGGADDYPHRSGPSPREAPAKLGAGKAVARLKPDPANLQVRRRPGRHAPEDPEND